MKITADFGEFNDHNILLEPNNYYDKSGSPCLTAREAGHYKPSSDLYFDVAEPLEPLMDIEADATLELLEEFRQETTDISYVQWLEQKLIALRQQIV